METGAKTISLICRGATSSLGARPVDVYDLATGVSSHFFERLNKNRLADLFNQSMFGGELKIQLEPFPHRVVEFVSDIIR